MERKCDTGEENVVARDEQDGGTVSERVVAGVAEALNVDVTAMEQLYSIVDPDALDHLFTPSHGESRGKGKVMFTMADCEVVVNGDGGVEVTPPDIADIQPVPREGAAGEETPGTATR